MPTRRLSSGQLLWDLLLVLTLLGGILLVGGCDIIELSENDPRGDLRYSLDKKQLTPGDSTLLRLQNSGSSQIGFNLTCSWADKGTNDGWTDGNLRRADSCFLYIRALEPGETATTQIHIDSSAAEGVYRFSTDVEIEDRRRPIFTETFQIEKEEN